MRVSARFGLIVTLAVALLPRLAFAQSQYDPPQGRPAGSSGTLQGFGGFRVGDRSTKPSLGGNLAINLTSGVQVIGEMGRMNNMLPPIIGDALSFTPVDLRVSAFYGEVGVRVVKSPHAIVSPYAEGTAGFARLRPEVSGFGEYDGVTNAVLRVLDRTEPVAGIGGGVIIHAGRLAVDLGYRYKRVISNDPLIQGLTLGMGMSASQVRMGIGVRF